MRPGRIASIVGAGIAGFALVVLVAAQLFLPGIAEQRVRDQLSRRGSVISVQIDAFPAIELLWNDADTVRIRLASYTTGSGSDSLGALLERTAGAGTVDASAATFTTGILRLHDASLRKRGDTLTGSARVQTSDLTSAIPFLTGVQPVASASGALTFRGTATLLGVSASIDASVAASDGRVLVAPDVPLGGLATLQVFADPHVAVQSVSAVPVAGGFTATATARLH